MKRLILIINISVCVMALIGAAIVDHKAPADEKPEYSRIETIEHDKHWFIMAKRGSDFLEHHPSCPCYTISLPSPDEAAEGP